jgi:hypothetical protein
MQTSPEIRHRLVIVIGNLICRCVEEARNIPYVLGQDQVLDILLGNAEAFAELVGDENRDHREFASNRITAKMDAAAELGQFRTLDAFDLSFGDRLENEAELEPLMNAIHGLTRTFMVYTGNALTIFEKEFQLFVDKFSRSLSQAGTSPRTAELTATDMAEFEKRAEEYLVAGQFLQAFLFGRLLHAQIITKELVRFPVSGRAFNRRLIEAGLADANLGAPLAAFILRGCYISQGEWQDLFDTLAEVADQEPGERGRTMLAGHIERDCVFCCNFIGESFSSLRQRTPDDRRRIIEDKLAACKLRRQTADQAPSPHYS